MPRPNRITLLFPLLFLLGACAERPWVGVTISNSPESIESCAPPRPGGGCR